VAWFTTLEDLDCKVAKNNLTKPIVLTTAEVAKFWSLVQKHGPNDCWGWAKYHNRLGYGIFTASKNRQFLAHRVACLLINKQLGKHVCHLCNNPGCCNPSHLIPGDAKINNGMKDQTKFHGEHHPMACLTEKQVLKIVKMNKQLNQNREGRPIGRTQIAKLTGFSEGSIDHILRGNSWSWLTGIKK